MAIQLDYTPCQRNHYEQLVNDQKIALIPAFTLESGRQLTSVPVAYKTWGTLNKDGDNALVLCHALSGSSDAEDWWRPLMGCGKAFDYNKFFIFCGNQLGSPYGSASPLTLNPETGEAYGPEFPVTTIRDDVLIHKLVLEALGVSSVAAVIGGSMGGMAALEWPLCTPEGYIKTIIAITTSSYQSAWGIAWNEAQRQAIMADAAYQAGWYEPVPSGQPVQGLGAARMVALLTYRSCKSFESRFHRRPAKARPRPAPSSEQTGIPTLAPVDEGLGTSSEGETAESTGRKNTQRHRPQPAQTRHSVPQYAAQSYLHYQAEKFLSRFDANCYISMTSKMDTHDITRGRIPLKSAHEDRGPTIEELRQSLALVPPGALVISVESDVLFRNEHQVELGECLPKAKFVNLDSADGHDGFLLEFDALATLVVEHLRVRVPWIYEGELVAFVEEPKSREVISSVFGEAEPEF